MNKKYVSEKFQTGEKRALPRELTCDLKETFITQHYKKPRVIWAF